MNLPPAVDQNKSESDKPAKETKDKTTSDLIVCACLTALAAILSFSLDIFEGVFEITRQYENLEVDELIPIIFTIAILASWFAYRRWRQQSIEFSSRIEIQKHLLEMERHIAATHRIQALGTLAGGVAHELNNILQPIIGLTSLMIHELKPSTDAANHLQKVKEAGVRANEIVSQLLRSVGNSDEERPLSRVDPRLEIEEAILLSRTGIPSWIRVEQTLNSTVGYITIVSGELHQVVTNLVHNAAQAMASHRGTISVNLDSVQITQDQLSLYPELDAQTYARITVTDDGPGFSTEMLNRALEPFVTTKPVGQGSGLGLAIVHGIVRIRGGAIRLQNQPDRGGLVEVLWPLS